MSFTRAHSCLYKPSITVLYTLPIDSSVMKNDVFIMQSSTFDGLNVDSI